MKSRRTEFSSSLLSCFQGSETIWYFVSAIWSLFLKGRLWAWFCPKGKSLQSVFGITLAEFFPIQEEKLMSLSRCGLSLLAICTLQNRMDKNSYGAFVLCSIFSHISLCRFFFFFLFKLFLCWVIGTEYCYSIVLFFVFLFLTLNNCFLFFVCF